MISVQYYNESGYGKIGLEHFIQTQGIISSENSPVNLAYGNVPKNNNFTFKIQVSNNPEINDFEDLIYCSQRIFNDLIDFENRNKFICSIPFITIGKNYVNINIDLFHFTGKCLSGHLESFWKSISKSEKEKLGKVPFIDVYEKVLFLVLLYAFEQQQLPLVCKAFWPGKSFAVCLTHDVDEVKKTYQWITKPIIYSKNMQMRLLKGQLFSLWAKLHGKEPYWTFDEIMKIEDMFDVRSSFYFLKEKGKAKVFAPGTWKLLGRRYDINDLKVRKVMTELYNRGWDVGLHGSYESYNDLKMLEKEKNELQTSLGQRIIGTRQHHLNIEIPRTWECHETIGLEYDTTLGFKDQMGFRGGTCLPFHPHSKLEKLNLLEIPLAIMDTPLFKDNNKNLFKYFEEMVNIASEFNGVLTLLWHHAVFNEHEFPGWSKAYEKIILLCNKKDAWITSGKDISEWWSWREKTDFKCGNEGTCLKITPCPEKGEHFLKIYTTGNMVINKISNADIIQTSKDSFTIRTNNLKNNESIEMEFTELNHVS